MSNTKQKLLNDQVWTLEMLEKRRLAIDEEVQFLAKQAARCFDERTQNLLSSLVYTSEKSREQAEKNAAELRKIADNMTPGSYTLPGAIITVTEDDRVSLPGAT